jgi:hypothetical protein
MKLLILLSLIINTFSQEHECNYLEILSSEKKEYCNNKITCISKQFDYPETFCYVKELNFNVKLFKKYMKTEDFYNYDDINDKYYIDNMPFGLFNLDCIFDASNNLFEKGSSRSLKNTLQASHKREDCYRVEEPTLFITDAYGKNNMWHATEDLIHTYKSYKLWNLLSNNTRIILLDAPLSRNADFIVQPYYSLYESTFALNYGYITAHKFINNLEDQNIDCITFKESYFQPHGGSSVFQRSAGIESESI